MMDYPSLGQVETAHRLLTPLTMGPILGFCGRLRDDNVFVLRVDYDVADAGEDTSRRAWFFHIAPDGEITTTASSQTVVPL